MARRQDLQKLSRAPVRVRDAFGHEQLGERRGDPVRAMPWRAASVRQAAPTLGVVAREPFVPDAAADAVPRTQLTHGEAISHRVAYELQSFVQGNTLLPGHRRSSRSGVSSCRLRVLPMLPDYSVTHLVGLYRKQPNRR